MAKDQLLVDSSAGVNMAHLSKAFVLWVDLADGDQIDAWHLERCGGDNVLIDDVIVAKDLGRGSPGLSQSGRNDPPYPPVELGHVTHSIDIRMAGLHTLVHQHATGTGQPSALREVEVRPNPRRDNHHIRFKDPATLQTYPRDVSVPFHKGAQIASDDADALCLDHRLQHAGTFSV